MLLAQRTLTAVQEARPLTDSSPHLILLTQAKDKDPNKERCGVFSRDCTTGTRRPEEAIFDNKLEVFFLNASQTQSSGISLFCHN